MNKGSKVQNKPWHCIGGGVQDTGNWFYHLSFTHQLRNSLPLASLNYQLIWKNQIILMRRKSTFNIWRNYTYLTLYTLTSVCIFSILFSVCFQRGWQGEFVSQSRAALVGDHLLYSYDFHVWFRGDIVRRT